MRVLVLAVGRLKKGAEAELAARYEKRVLQAGRRSGLRDIEIIEIRESRAADAGKRMIEESIAIASLVPEGAMTVILDERGDNIGSAAFAEKLGNWRDNGMPMIKIASAPFSAATTVS